MGVVTRAAKPDLDPETRRWFGRPLSAPSGQDVTADMKWTQASPNGAFLRYRFGPFIRVEQGLTAYSPTGPCGRTDRR
jgi:hypothetical protein